MGWKKEIATTGVRKSRECAPADTDVLCTLSSSSCHVIQSNVVSLNGNLFRFWRDGESKWQHGRIGQAGVDPRVSFEAPGKRVELALALQLAQQLTCISMHCQPQP